MANGRDKFEGQTTQFQKDTTERLNRLEEKLDRMIERNIIISAFVALVTALIVAMTGRQV